MSFVREKEIPPGSGNKYLYEVKNYRDGGKVVQKHIRYIGRAGGSGGGLGTTSRTQTMSTSVSHVELQRSPSLGTTPQNQPDAIAKKAKEIFDKTRPSPQVLKVYGERSLSPIQRATLPEIETHLRLVDKVGKEVGKTLDYEKYPLGTTEEQLRAQAKIYWTKGRRIQAAKKAQFNFDAERDMILEAQKYYPHSTFLESILDQIGRQHRMSAKQKEAIEKMIKEGAAK